MFPPIFLYAKNQDQGISFTEFVVPFAILIALTMLLILVAKLVIKDSAKASVMVSLIVVTFFVYGPLYDVLATKNQEWAPGTFIMRHRYFLLFIFLVTLAGLIALLRYRGNLVTLARVAGTAALILVVFNLGRIAVEEVSASFADTGSNKNIAQTSGTRTVAELPDIYYIVLDGYGSADTLQTNLGHDNSGFIESLTRKGFYVAQQSRSNYIETEYSLTSSLNMRYLENQDQRFPNMKNTTALRTAKDLGYLYLHTDSGMWMSDRNQHADIEFLGDNSYEILLNDFSSALLDSSVLAPVLPEFGLHLDELHSNKGALQFKHNMDILRTIPDYPEPTFTFNHNIVPHPPYVYDRNGNRPTDITLPPGTVSEWQDVARYVDQLIYTNKRMVEFVGYVLERSTVDPIIIIQGDHGPASTCCTGGRRGFSNPTDALMLERTAILNAIYVPESCRSDLYPSISPVNNLRVVFNCLGADLPLLEDETYWSNSGSNFDRTPIDFSLLE
jgi:hypothetical protein